MLGTALQLGQYGSREMRVSSMTALDSRDITCGGIRDHEGKWIGGFTKKLGKGNILLAEMCGILEGLQVAWHNNLKKIIIESDSLQAVSYILASLDRKHPLYPILHKIKLLLANDWDVKVIHISRDSNRIADNLAFRAHVLDFGLYIYDAPPASCVELYRDDSRKASLPALPVC
ncbi:RnaseH [Senna tora]|uniref:RnaseH (Mitochondrion) n=1 Tax=Senna tora TaxID=362788 RepID=A0A834XHB2_9FABA|nr:RnaseH [Senna tora]